MKINEAQISSRQKIGKLSHLGYFATPEEASAAYEAMRLKLYGPDYTV